MADYAAADDAATSDLLGQLWNLVEAWSSGAIRHARASAEAHAGAASDAEIRILVEHAAELRMVLEGYLDRADRPGAQLEAELAVALNLTLEAPAAVPATPADHRCNSADFERPLCADCGRQHWHCSICGEQQDECAS
jgi:hypothetical protein